MDAETQQPIRNVKVQLEGTRLTTSVTTDRQGRYEVGPLRCWRFCFWVAGPEGIWPQDCKHYSISGDMMFTLNASRSGYEPASVSVPRCDTNSGAMEVAVQNILLQPVRQPK